MARRKHLRLSSGELEIMSMLWEQGPLTLAQAHQRFGRYGREVGYPTMQTRLNRLVDKGFVARSTDRPASYRALVNAGEVGTGHLEFLVEKLGRKSVVPLVAHLMSERPLTSDEIAELKRLLQNAERSAENDG